MHQFQYDQVRNMQKPPVSMSTVLGAFVAACLIIAAGTVALLVVNYHWSERAPAIVIGPEPSGGYLAACQFGSVTMAPGPDGKCWWEQGDLRRNSFVKEPKR
jgi:hypothetical protein